MNFKIKPFIRSSGYRNTMGFVSRRVPSPLVVNKKRTKTVTTAALVPLSDIHWYSMTSTDLFAFYATHAFLTTHAPLLLMYRGFFQLPWTISANLLLFVSVFKSISESF